MQLQSMRLQLYFLPYHTHKVIALLQVHSCNRAIANYVIYYQ